MLEHWNPLNCSFYFLTTKKKLIGTFVYNSVTFIGENASLHTNTILRGEENADNVLEAIDGNNSVIGLEGYAFGASRSLVFNIAEHTAVLKYKLINNKHTLNIIPPTVAKKYATGKGNANKEMMVDAMIKDSSIFIFDAFGYNSTNIASPVNDLADAYWLCKYQHSQLYRKTNDK